MEENVLILNFDGVHKMNNNAAEQIVDTKIVNRIRKMLSIAHGTAAGGEHERDTAMKMVLTLMAKHNLNMTDMVEKHQTVDENRVQEDVIFRDEPWARSIVASMAKLFFCLVYTSRRGKEIKYVFIGRESNVQTAKEMCAYLIDSVSKESRKVTTTLGGGSSTFKTSFRKGASSKISQRADELRRDAEKDSVATKTPGTALVLAGVYAQEMKANERVLAGTGVTLSAAVNRTAKSVNALGYHVGSQFGAKVGLTKQVR